MKPRRFHPVCRAIALGTAAMFLASTVNLAVLVRDARADAREELTRAEDYFLVADFATALQKVDALLDSNELTGGALRDAWVLKARCEVGLAHKSTAVDAFCQALRVEPTWRPDPDLYTKDELEVFEQARASCAPTSQPQKPAEPERAPSRPLGDRPVEAPKAAGESKPWYKKPVVLGLGGALVLGGIVLAASGGGDDESDLPGFPAVPE